MFRLFDLLVDRLDDPIIAFLTAAVLFAAALLVGVWLLLAVERAGRCLARHLRRRGCPNCNGAGVLVFDRVPFARSQRVCVICRGTGRRQ